MDRKPTSNALKSWQFYSACLYHLDMPFMVKLFKRSCRQILRWASDPDTTESHQRNPVDRYEYLLRALMERGRVDVARGCVRRQAYIVGCFLTENEASFSDKGTLAEECLDDVPAVAEYHEVLMDPRSSAQEVREILAQAIGELRENYAKWCEERGVVP